MTRTYRGSCHCGAVALEVDADLHAGHQQMQLLDLQQDALLEDHRRRRRVPAPARRGRARRLPVRRRVIHHRFCRHCGVKTFGTGRLATIGEFYAVNLACLDDASDEELSRAPIGYEDGRHDRWDRVPAKRGICELGWRGIMRPSTRFACSG